MKLLHQIFLDKLICHRLHIQDDAAAENGRQKRIYIRCQQQNNRIGRRFLQGFQNRVLRLRCHLLRLVDNINLIGTAVGLDAHIVIDLRTDVIDTDGIRLFMCHMNNIGMVVRQRLLAGMTFLTRLRPLLFTLQRHSKDPRNELLAGGFLTVDDVRMGNLSRPDRILQVFLHLLLSYNVPKVSHTPSFLCTFHTNPM